MAEKLHPKDLIDMLTPLFTVKTDFMLDARLRLLDAWEEWEVPSDQQLKWWIELFDVEEIEELGLYQMEAN